MIGCRGFKACILNTDTIQYNIATRLVVLQRSLWLRHFKSDWGESWQDCSSSKYTLSDRVGFIYGVILSRWWPWHPPLLAAASAGFPPSARLQFLIHSSFVLAKYSDQTQRRQMS